MGIGINATTPVVVKKVGEKYEARVGIALFGSTNMPMEEIEKNPDPFSPDWYDNICRGFGSTEEEAKAALQEDYNLMGESIWN